MHERSETIQRRSGKWVNIYGRGTENAGRPLKPLHEFERDEYDSLDEALDAARKRSMKAGEVNE